jgi:hypothetical protein
MTEDLKKSVETLCCALRKDPQYFESWKANIAMSFKDEFRTVHPGAMSPNEWNNLHQIANTAAENFLNLLIRESNVQEKVSKEGN